ncbi:BatD family protein [Chitinophaga nivalis]|uniref:BatD family protein n=1 Tax=Chitinophaga nivalis TaxID=2991709 RepID=A0ABT3IVU8_9BACT|nr:BatD family protein [Chitinophaga nivalis]MCW3462485.1 BatD family protein [Chitinophaga nivalis]MCW3487824.1 BatD family protein [Chitinophaga nivalis]
MMDRYCIRKCIYSLLLCIGLVAGANAQEFRFTTTVSSNTVMMDEPFQIQFMLENGTNVSSFTPPSFKDFDVLQGPSQMQGQSIFNGRRSEYYALTYTLQPKHVGNFTIAGAQARVNGNMVKSNPVLIEVKKGNTQAMQPSPGPASGYPPHRAQQGGDDLPEGVLKKGEDVTEKLRKNIFLKVDVDKTNLYEGDQITATYKLYTRLPTNSSVTKVPAFKGFSAKDIELPNPPQATEERVNGVPYKVFTIRKTLLFPLQSGALELDPVEVDNQVRLVKVVSNNNKKNRSHDPFEDFFNDPAFKDPFFDDFFNRPEVEYQDVPYKIQSNPIKITVKPLPVDGRPLSFNGAVGKFNMTATVDKTSLSTDEALTLKVVVSGEGNVNLLNSPKIDIPSGFEKYDPKVTDDIEKNSNPLSGSRTFEYVLMPQEAGDHTIPAVEFSFFDPASNGFKTLRSTPFVIHISQGKRIKQDKQDFSVGKNELVKNDTGILTWTKQQSWLIRSPWFYILLLLPLLVVAGIVVYKRRADYKTTNAALLKHRYANKVALKRLELAARYLKDGKDKSFYEETSRAVWGYLSNKLKIPMADLSKQLVQDKLSARQINGSNTNNLFELIDNCEMALYAPAHNNHKMQGTYEQAVNVISNLEDALKN